MSGANLRPSTVDRVVSFWQAWAATPAVVGEVSIVAIGDAHLVYAPEHLRGRLAGVPVEPGALVDALSEELKIGRAHV